MTAAAFAPAASLAQEAPLKIGVVTFLSGPAASPFGVPARNAAEIMVEMLNGTKVPAPYAARGFGGAALQMQLVDESGPATTHVTEFHNLAQRDNVDMVIGYVSSGNCLAVAPVAEELKKLTVFFDCGTPRIFEEKSYKYVFRTASTATMDSVGAALYVKELKAGKIKSIAGVNQNYAWGQDSWVDFEASMKQLAPGVQVATSQMAQAILGTKAAWEKAQSANGGNRPTTDQVIAAFERLTFESPAGKVEMVIGAGHQAITETAYGVSKLVKGKMTVANVRRYPATMVNPPDGVKASDWIANGFKK